MWRIFRYIFLYVGVAGAVVRGRGAAERNFRSVQDPRKRPLKLQKIWRIFAQSTEHVENSHSRLLR